MVIAVSVWIIFLCCRTAEQKLLILFEVTSKFWELGCFYNARVWGFSKKVPEEHKIAEGKTKLQGDWYCLYAWTLWWMVITLELSVPLWLGFIPPFVKVKREISLFTLINNLKKLWRKKTNTTNFSFNRKRSHCPVPERHNNPTLP